MESFLPFCIPLQDSIIFSSVFILFYLKGSMFDNIGADLPRGLFPCFATLKTKTESVPQVFRSRNQIYHVKSSGFSPIFSHDYSVLQVRHTHKCSGISTNIIDINVVSRRTTTRTTSETIYQYH